MILENKVLEKYIEVTKKKYFNTKCAAELLSLIYVITKYNVVVLLLGILIFGQKNFCDPPSLNFHIGKDITNYLTNLFDSPHFFLDSKF